MAVIGFTIVSVATWRTATFERWTFATPALGRDLDGDLLEPRCCLRRKEWTDRVGASVPAGAIDG